MTHHIALDRSTIHNSMTIQEICSQYPPIGWEHVFQRADPEIQLLTQIIQRFGNFFPDNKDLFRAFDECPLQNIKIVILGQDPYHSTHEGKPQANGMAFSTNRGCPIQPSLKNIYKEIKNEYPEFEIPSHGDLSWWANQGVLLLNSCLTVTPHQPGSHKEIWNGFVTKVLDAVTEQNPECIYLLWGKKANTIAMTLGQRAIKLTASHPSPLSASKGSKDAPAFLGCGHFREANNFLIQQGKTPINWRLPL